MCTELINNVELRSPNRRATECADEQGRAGIAVRGPGRCVDTQRLVAAVEQFNRGRKWAIIVGLDIGPNTRHTLVKRGGDLGWGIAERGAVVNQSHLRR